MTLSGTRMKAFGLATSLLLALALAACNQAGSGSSSGSSGSMYITTCSLGCPSGLGGFQVSCPPLQIAVNQEISITFSLPVDPTTLDSTTFQLIDEASGAVPVGTRLIDPGDPHRVIFRPAIAFDSQGNPSFGFTAPTTYRVLIPGTAQGDTGPFINSTSGKSNQSRMNCQLQTTANLVDYVPGPPTVVVKVDLADLSTTNVNDFIPDQLADGAVNVWRNSTVRFIFNDVMNPATLANPVTHQPAFASVQVDADGLLATSADRVTLFGNYIVNIDLTQLQTVMTFTSTRCRARSWSASLRGSRTSRVTRWPTPGASPSRPRS